MQSVWFVSIRECRRDRNRPRADVDSAGIVSCCSVCVCVDRANGEWFDAEVVVEVWTGLSVAKRLGPLWGGLFIQGEVDHQ